MIYCERIMALSATVAKWLCIPLLALTAACDSQILKEAKHAEKNGAVISNEMMSAMYPQSFHPGTPPYLERDFEAGADFICAEIRTKYRRDICSETEINWK